MKQLFLFSFLGFVSVVCLSCMHKKTNTNALDSALPKEESVEMSITEQEKNADTVVASFPCDNAIDDSANIKKIMSFLDEKNLWYNSIEKSSQYPLFYERTCDDGLDLYCIVYRNNDTIITTIDDDNISYLIDIIEDTNWEHKGYYEIIDDSTVDIIFDDWYLNVCQTNDSVEEKHRYHYRGTHRYKLSDVKWNLVRADTAILVDERNHFCGEVIWEYIKPYK